MNKLEPYIRNYENSHSFCDFLKFIAANTWCRIYFVRNNNGINIYEPTITQDIVYRFMLGKILYKWNVELSEATNESVSGNDIELVIFRNSRPIKLFIQAKMLYLDNRYTQMRHDRQIDSLLAYSELKGGIPLYLLYNYYPGNINPLLYKKELYGCTIINANFLNRNYAKALRNRNGELTWRTPTFENLHPIHAYPWHILACKDESGYLPEEFFKKMGLTGQESLSIKTLTKEEVYSEPGWKQINMEVPEIEKKDVYIERRRSKISTKDLKEKKEPETQFYPKFRIIVEDDFLTK